MKRYLKRFSFICLLASLLVPSAVMGEFYQYEDENGALVFTDNPTKIPKKKHKNKTRRTDDGYQAGSSTMPVTINGNRVILPVTLNYRGSTIDARFVLDTGAEVSTMTPQLAQKLNIDPEDAELAIAQGIGSGYHLTGKVKMDYVLVGPNRKYDIDFIVIPGGGVDGLLGMNFLRELRYHVDFARRTIKWGD